MSRVYAAIFAVVGWSAVIGQYIVSNDHTLTSTISFFSYFTILSNVLVALTLSSVALAPDSPVGRLFTRPVVATSIALYITVTGLVYYFLLSSLYDLKGWVLTFDRLLHYVMPPAYVLFWLVFVRKGTLHIYNIAPMLAFPLLYAVYTLSRGAIVDWYPYPFIDVTELGYPRTFRNVFEFVIFFAFASSIYVLIDRLIGHFMPGRQAAVREAA